MSDLPERVRLAIEQRAKNWGVRAVAQQHMEEIARIAMECAPAPEERAPLLAEWISPEPTPEMIAAVNTILSPHAAKLVWARMLKAALIPPPPMNGGSIK